MGGPFYCNQAHKALRERTGLKLDSAAREKLRQAHLGHRHTEEAKAKIGAASRGKVLSVETRRRISESNSGNRFGEEQLARFRRGQQARRSRDGGRLVLPCAQCGVTISRAAGDLRKSAARKLFCGRSCSSRFTHAARKSEAKFLDPNTTI
jgi:hypothetical protein